MNPSRSKKPEILLLILSTCVGIVLAFFLGEMYFQKKYWHGVNTQFDPTLGWAPIPNSSSTQKGKQYSTNSLGFRSEEVSPGKNHILIAGDSVAWGFGVGDAETLSFDLKEKLKDHQILNLAVSGYDLGQTYLHLKQQIKNLNPKIIVVVVFAGNDLIEALSDTNYGKSKPLFKYLNNELVLTNPKISRFSCANLFSKSLLLRRFSQTKFNASICKNDTQNLMMGIQVTRALLSKISELATAHGSDLLFVLSPQFFDAVLGICENQGQTEVCKSFHKKFVNLIFHPPNVTTEEVIQFHKTNGSLAIFRRIFQESSYDFVDYYQEILGWELPIEELKKFYIDNDHYSSRGTKKLADVIYNRVEKNILAVTAQN